MLCYFASAFGSKDRRFVKKGGTGKGSRCSKRRILKSSRGISKTTVRKLNLFVDHSQIVQLDISPRRFDKKNKVYFIVSTISLFE